VRAPRRDTNNACFSVLKGDPFMAAPFVVTPGNDRWVLDFGVRGAKYPASGKVRFGCFIHGIQPVGPEAAVLIAPANSLSASGAYAHPGSHAIWRS
jgi:hypothetical protein